MKGAIRHLAIGLLALAVIGTPPAVAQDLPTNQETLNVLRDQWGRTTFPPTGVGDWTTTSHWTRVRQHLFPPGTNEFTGKPVEIRDLKPRTLELFARETPKGVERGIIEDVTEAGGSVTHNYFPPFRGRPDAFVFYNDVTRAGEYQERCRTLRDFLLCRVIRPDGGVYYQVNAATGTRPGRLPSVRRMLAVFRDQWGRDRFRPTGIGAWNRISAWNRVRTLFFAPGTNEFTSPGVESPGVPLRFELYRRTLPGGKVQYGVFHIAPEVPAFTRFPVFRGDPEAFTFYVVNTPEENPGAPVGEFEETCRVLHRDGDAFLICRTITPDGGIDYQTAVPI